MKNTAYLAAVLCTLAIACTTTKTKNNPHSFEHFERGGLLRDRN